MKKRTYSSIPTDGLTGQYLLDGNANDTSFSGNDGTASNVSWANDYIGYQTQVGVFNGTNAKINFGNIGNIKSVAFWINLDSTTENIFEGASNDLELYANGGTLTYPDWDNVYVDLIDTDTITTGRHFIVLTSSTDVNCTAFQMGIIDSTYGDFNAAGLRTYTAELTTSEIKSLYLEGKRKLVDRNYNESFKGALAVCDLKGDVADISGNGRDGSASGASLATDSFGFANSAYSLNGSSNYCSLLDNNPVRLPTGSYIIGSKFKLDSINATQTLLDLNYSSSGTNVRDSGIRLTVLSDNTIETRVFITGTTDAVTATSTTTVSADTRYYVIAVRDVTTSTIKLYINGVLEDTTTSVPSGNVDYDADDYEDYKVNIGRYSRAGGTAYFLAGDIDSFFIFDGSESQNDIDSLFLQLDKKYVYPRKKTYPRRFSDNLVLHLNGTYASTTDYDQSGNGNNGTINFTTIGRIGQHNYYDLDGSDDKITVGTINSVNAVSFRMYADANTHDIIVLTASDKITIDASNDITLTGFSGLNANVYINGHDGNAVTTSKWIFVTVTFDDLNCDGIDIGDNGDYNGRLADITMFNVKPTQQQVQELYYNTYINNLY